MMNVISSEIYKIVKSKIFYGILIIFLFMNLFTLASGVRMKLILNSGQKIEEGLETGISIFQSSYNFDGILYIIMIFVIFSITSEYMNKNTRQMACHGISRWKLVLGQYIGLSLVMTIVLLVFGYINLFFFTILFQLGSVDIKVFLRMNFGLICIIWSVSAIGVFISHLIKNMGISIIISILLLIGSNVASDVFAVKSGNEVFKILGFTSIRRIILEYSSRKEDIIICCFTLILIGVISSILSSLIFSKRDID